MTKTIEPMHQTLNKEFLNSMAQILVDIKDTDRAVEFLSDFFSETEKNILLKKLAVSYFLTKGRSYENISRNVGVDDDFITMVSQEMQRPSYNKAIKLMVAEEWAEIWSKKILKFVGK